MNYKEALSYTMDLCSRQEKCSSEIREKLEKFNLPGEDVEKVLHSLKKEGFIDESRYAGMFVRDKLRFNRWGRVKIRYMLSARKIPEEIIYAVLCHADHLSLDRKTPMDRAIYAVDELTGLIIAVDGIDNYDYVEILKEELLKKRSQIKDSNPYTVRNKLVRFGQQRGFESGLIYQVLDEMKKT